MIIQLDIPGQIETHFDVFTLKRPVARFSTDWITKITKSREFYTPDFGGDTSDGAIPEGFRDLVEGLVRPANWHGKGSKAVTEGACHAAIAFVAEARSECAELDLPRVGPSVLGGVALQWDFEHASFMVRVSDASGRVTYQEEGPDFAQDDGSGSRADVVERLLTARRGSRRS